MTLGIASAIANGWLNVLRGTTFTGLAGLYVKLHIGDPQGSGTAAPSAVTTRNALTLNAPSGGSSTMSSLAPYAMTATEAISHVSLWDNPSAGSLVASGAMSAAKNVNSGDTLTFDTFTVSIAPLAA